MYTELFRSSESPVQSFSHQVHQVNSRLTLQTNWHTTKMSFSVETKHKVTSNKKFNRRGRTMPLQTNWQSRENELLRRNKTQSHANFMFSQSFFHRVNSRSPLQTNWHPMKMCKKNQSHAKVPPSFCCVRFPPKKKRRLLTTFNDEESCALGIESE